jgi:hypothetical protein
VPGWQTVPANDEQREQEGRIQKASWAIGEEERRRALDRGEQRTTETGEMAMEKEMEVESFATAAAA